LKFANANEVHYGALGFISFHDAESIISRRLCRHFKFSLPNISLFPTLYEHSGHCNTEITSNICVHIFKEYKAKMAESIEHDLL